MRFFTIIILAASIIGYTTAQNKTRTTSAAKVNGVTIKANPAASASNKKLNSTAIDALADVYLKNQHNKTDVNPFVVANLVVNDIASFNGSDLEKPEKEAEEAFGKFWNHTTTMLQHQMQNPFMNKTNDVEELKEEIHLLIDALAKVENLDVKAMQKLDEVFRSHPEYAAYSQMFVQANSGLFEKQELDAINLFFTAANDYNPEITDKIIDILNINQKKYNVVPADFYKKVQLAYAGRS